MIYKIGLLGASGRMGQEVAALLAEDPKVGTDSFELADGITQSGRMTSLDGVSLRTVGEPAREPVHVWIDFSRPEATIALLETAGTPVVICTTGFTPAQRARVETYAQKHAVLMAANTSPGMQWFTRALEKAPSLAGLGFSAVLSEDHHIHKKDSPSGTAKRILESLKKQGFENVEVQVTRAGSIVGTHTVRFIADGEEITLTHRATDRRIFARGALLAARFLLQQKKPGLYSFEDVSFDLGDSK
ncbi:4-hydroxy-tetrahydrodipicolinate reductase [bacterium]|nr:4-hydroxy-tetrahydrodipicolinate reductase [bacterium]